MTILANIKKLQKEKKEEMKIEKQEGKLVTTSLKYSFSRTETNPLSLQNYPTITNMTSLDMAKK